ncbi:unnamed protein product [Phytomonas sp. Hart1]|nr:unnamed protein product [Phytomonas sp. Hart1]|eukprot:CCW69546.1 unnamed protein product [Phytomonas sp. isolate Hart1]
MTFVFEARLMPFGRITEELASSAADFFIDYDSEFMMEFNKMPLWNRCMLAAVIPVILQRHQDLYQQQRGCLSDKKSVSDSIETVKVTQNDFQIALKIVNDLDELEVAAERIKSMWADKDEKYELGPYDESNCTFNNNAHPMCQDHRTEEDTYINRVLREHLRSNDQSSFSCISDSSIPQNNNEHNCLYEDNQIQEKEEVDIAMCFNLNGVSIGMGSTRLFGGHGYHLPVA